MNSRVRWSSGPKRRDGGYAKPGIYNCRADGFGADVSDDDVRQAVPQGGAARGDHRVQMDTWITKIVVREILMLMRSAKRRTDHNLVSSLDDPIYFAVRDRLTASVFSPERTAIGKEALEQVLEAIYELKDDQRDALLTRCDLTRTIKENAVRLDCKRTKLQAQICRGRVALRKKLQIV